MNKDAYIGLWTMMVVVLFILFNSVKDKGLIDFNKEIGLLFTQVHGLRAGDPVTIGGVPSGRVVEIDFAPQEIQDSLAPVTGGTTLVRAMVSLDRDIPRESTYSVRVDLNGRRWLDITLSPSSEMIGAEDNFFAEVAVGQDDQLQRTVRTFSTLGEQTEALRTQLTAPDFLLRTKDTASNLRFYSRELVAASAEAPQKLMEFEDDLDKQETALLQQIQSFDDKTQEVSRRMLEMAPQLSENLKGWTLRMERQSERLTSTLQMASSKSVEYQKLLDDAILSQLSPEATEKLIYQTKKWSRKLQEYRYMAEDLHSLTSDPTIRSDLKKAIDDFRIKSEELNERILKLEEMLDANPLTSSSADDEDEENKVEQ
jgi:ABC-type transporter Mla subunit MlaD